MIHANPLHAPVAFHLGPVPVTDAVVVTWALMALMTLSSWAILRRPGGRLKAALVLLVETMLGQIEEAVKTPARPFLPLVGTLFLYLAVANLSGEVPGIHAPTARLETAGALALIVFGAVHVFGVRRKGVGGYLGHYLKPNPLLLPLNVASELTRTLSLMVRLFGNLMSHELVLAVVLALAGLLVPVPLMVLGVLIGLIQAYIFAVLATVFLGAAVGGTEGH